LASNFGALKNSVSENVKTQLKGHLARIPKTLNGLDLKFEIADFSDYRLEPNSIDILVATKSLMYAVRDEPQVVRRYLSALRTQGVAYLTLEEFLSLINFIPASQTPNQFADYKRMQQEGHLANGKRIVFDNGMVFEPREIVPFTTNRDARDVTWAVLFLRPEYAASKRWSFVGTGPIFEVTRIQ
jgi:hypothetical protein